jgi:hypothetical protein
MSILINGKATKTFQLKRGEAKILQFDYSGDIVDATFDLIIQDVSGAEIIHKVNTDFDRTQILLKTIFVTLTSADLLIPVATYSLEVKVSWDSETDIDLTETIKMKIIKSLHYPEVEEGE